MRTRWHKWWLAAWLVTACGLNPQPDIPAKPSNGVGAAGAQASGDGSGRGGSGSQMPGAPQGGGLSIDQPGNEASAGDSALGAGGASDAEGGAGGAADGGASGADQLGPGLPK